MRIAVIGPSGQLGSDLVPILSLHHEVVKLEHTSIEVSDLESVSKVLAEVNPGMVINTSAYHKLEEAEENPYRAFAVNTIGPRNLALTCRVMDVPLLHLSTDYVFSGRKESPYIESDSVDPINTYGISKVAGEMALRCLWPRHFIVRTGALYGKAGSSGKGGNFVELMLRLASEAKPIRVVKDQTMTPTSTQSLAQQIVTLIKSDRYGTYHATCQGSCTWFDFAAEIFGVSGLKPDLSPQTTSQSGARVRRPAYSVLDNHNLNLLGLDLMPHWTEALKEYLDQRLHKKNKSQI
jgi:dTDP-4-dehydrorhamnose reductase